jgi:hypothetical protein
MTTNQKATHLIFTLEDEIYIPTYVSLGISKLESLNIRHGTVFVVGILQFRILKSSKENLMPQILSKSIQIRINGTLHKLTEETPGVEIFEKTEKSGETYLCYVYRFSEKIIFQPEVWGIPFDYFLVPIEVEALSGRLDSLKTPLSKYRLHFHKNMEPGYGLGLERHADRLREYFIDYSKIHTELVLSERIIEKSTMATYCSKISFNLPIYRDPRRVILTTLNPVLMLGVFLLILNLDITFNISDIPEKNHTGIVVTILIALYIFIPYLKEQIPPDSPYTLSDFLILLSIMQIFCVFLNGILIQQETLPLFIIASSIFALQLAIVVFFSIQYMLRQKSRKNSTPWMLKRPFDVKAWQTKEISGFGSLSIETE